MPTGPCRFSPQHVACLLVRFFCRSTPTITVTVTTTVAIFTATAATLYFISTYTRLAITVIK